MTDPLLRIVDLKTHFQTKGAGLFGEKKVIMAVDGVSFDIARGEVLSLVGESGCGKSTVGRTLTHLEKATSGQAFFEGQDFLSMTPRKFRPLRREIQMIFQDPFASLNPRLKIEQTLGEPLFIHGLCKNWNEARICEEPCTRNINRLSRHDMPPLRLLGCGYCLDFGGFSLVNLWPRQIVFLPLLKAALS